eukprot:2300468-Prymnesium_polylepis.1
MAHAATAQTLSLERLKELQADALADDVDIDLETMRLWDEERARNFFENGGSHTAPISRQNIRDILDGKPPPEEAASPAGQDGADVGADGDLPPDGDPDDHKKSAPLPDIYETLGGQSQEEKEQEARPKHELPVPPESEVMTVDEAY